MNPDVKMFGQVMMIIIMTVASFVAIGLSARLLWRWGSRTKPVGSLAYGANDDRLRHLETAVDSIAIEVERISEAQRFMVGLLGESSQIRRAERAELPVPNQKSGRTNTPH
jgi:hypothetical protein